MSNNFIREGNRIYLPFEFDGEMVYPEDYLIYQQMRELEMWEQYLEEYKDEKEI